MRIGALLALTLLAASPARSAVLEGESTTLAARLAEQRAARRLPALGVLAVPVAPWPIPRALMSAGA